MTEYLNQRETIVTQFANRLYWPRSKATAIRRCNLVTLTSPNREKLSQPRKVNVGPYPPEIQRNWPATLKAKEAEATESSHTPTLTQPAEAPVTQSNTSLSSPDTKYCMVCTPLGKFCPSEYPITLDWDEDLGEEEQKDQNKEGNFSVCWVGNIGNEKIKRTMTRKTPQTGPKSSSFNTFISKPSKFSTEQLGSQSSASQRHKFRNLTLLIYC